MRRWGAWSPHGNWVTYASGSPADEPAAGDRERNWRRRGRDGSNAPPSRPPPPEAARRACDDSSLFRSACDLALGRLSRSIPGAGESATAQRNSLGQSTAVALRKVRAGLASLGRRDGSRPAHHSKMRPSLMSRRPEPSCARHSSDRPFVQEGRDLEVEYGHSMAGWPANRPNPIGRPDRVEPT